MSRMRVKITFPKEKVTEPLIYMVGQNFQVVTNIRRANIDEYAGWVILEIDGQATEIERAIDWMQKKGVRVDPVEGTVMEG